MKETKNIFQKIRENLESWKTNSELMNDAIWGLKREMFAAQVIPTRKQKTAKNK